MKPMNFNEDTFMGIEIFGKQGLFTNMRIDRNTVPEELYAYDCRDADSDGCICEIRKFIMVNHWGTVFFLEPIENFTPSESLYYDDKLNMYSAFVNDETDVNYLNDNVDPKEFIANNGFLI